LHIIKNKFNTKDRGAPKSAGPVAIATFATIVNPALTPNRLTSRRSDFTLKCIGGFVVYLTIIVKSNQLRVLLESYGQSGASLLFRLALASQL